MFERATKGPNSDVFRNSKANLPHDCFINQPTDTKANSNLEDQAGTGFFGSEMSAYPNNGYAQGEVMKMHSERKRNHGDNSNDHHHDQSSVFDSYESIPHPKEH